MTGLKPEETKQIKGMTLRRDPAREDCFQVVHSDAEMQEWPGMTEISQRQRIHRHMNNETGAIEIAAGIIVAIAPRIGAFVVAGWLAGIIINLLTKNAPQYYDIALRDFGLMLAALTLGRLSLAVVPARK